MNPISNIDSQPTNSDLLQLREELDTHITRGTTCEAFFLNYSQTDGIPDALNQMQLRYTPEFLKMFDHQSHRKEVRFYQKKKYQSISKYAESAIPIEEKEKITGELSELKNKMELSKKTDKSFRKNIVILIQTKPEILLTEEFDITTGKQPFKCPPISLGRIFFLPEMNSPEGPIGECHCCYTMDRKSRNDFSHRVIDEITKHFPEKKSISVAAIGAGMCFQELEIHTLAQEKGYTISKWSLVDPYISSKTVTKFETIAKWATPYTFVSTVKQNADQYFTNLGKPNATRAVSKPDLFLFIDVPIEGSEIRSYAENLDSPSLYAYFSKKISWATYHEPKAKNSNKESV